MNKVDEAIKRFRERPKHDHLFLEAQAELRLSEKMLRLRLDAGFTQKGLADRLNVSQAHIAKLEGGSYEKCGIGSLRSIALALGHDIDFDAMFTRRHRRDAPQQVGGVGKSKKRLPSAARKRIGARETPRSNPK